MSLLYLIAGMLLATCCQILLPSQSAYAFAIGVVAGSLVTMFEKRGGRE